MMNNAYQQPQTGYPPAVVPTPPPPPPIITHSPPPQPNYGPGSVLPPFGVPQQSTGFHGPQSGYDLHEDDHGDDMDTGDIPLLRRDPASSNTLSVGGFQMPGSYDDLGRPMSASPSLDDRSEVNIRYGRIPQRVPRRYKTVKKVE